MANARNAVASRDSHIWSLRMCVVILLLIVAYLIHINQQQVNNQTLHIPPDLSKGAAIKPGQLNAANAHTFASVTWAKINEWRDNGRDNYLNNIETFDCLITPRFRQWLKEDYKNKDAQGELLRERVFRQRGFYKPDSVKSMGPGFVVGLEFDILEEIKRETFKEVSIHYPMAVVPDTRSCNVMGMALDGFYQAPYRLEASDDQ